MQILFVFVGEPAISSSQGTTTEIGTASLDLTGVSATLAQGTVLSEAHYKKYL
jgi:hypothetical protein